MDLEGRDPRYDLYRIRSNLCELPTTYISNNCQMNLPNGLTDVMDYLEKCPKGPEWREQQQQQQHLTEAGMNSKIKPRSSPGKYGRGMSCFEKSPLKNVVHITNLEPHLRTTLPTEVDRRKTAQNQCCHARFECTICFVVCRQRLRFKVFWGLSKRHAATPQQCRL